MNLICIGQNILESCFVNGLWTAWGPMGVYFKQNDFFIEYCTDEGIELPRQIILQRNFVASCRHWKFDKVTGAWKGEKLNCNDRDELFNSIFTTASITFGVGAFLFGLLSGPGSHGRPFTWRTRIDRIRSSMTARHSGPWIPNQIDLASLSAD